LTPFDNLNGVGPSIPVEAGDYLVLHYGKGDGGTGKGGGVLALYFDSAGTYQVPDNGSGPNGLGGVSFARLWDDTPDTSVPDNGSSVALMGMSLSGLVSLARLFKR
jgi:hypothetical protein